MSHTQYMAADGINRVNVSEESPLPVAAQNITTKFRDAFESLIADNWTTITGTGDVDRRLCDFSRPYP